MIMILKYKNITKNEKRESFFSFQRFNKHFAKDIFDMFFLISRSVIVIIVFFIQCILILLSQNAVIIL
jgi:lipopolysaccharide/colanic/teichoic acid biosynthesis glycosyltransferase